MSQCTGRLCLKEMGEILTYIPLAAVLNVIQHSPECVYYVARIVITMCGLIIHPDGRVETSPKISVTYAYLCQYGPYS